MMGTPNLLLLALIGAGWCGVLVTCEFTLGTDASPFLCYGEGGLWCGGDANVGSNGVLNLTPDDRTKPQHHVRTVGMALVSSPIDMRGYLYGWKSFRTHFTFRIEPIHPPGDGLAFVMLGGKEMGTEGGNLGVYNRSGWQNVQTVAIEFDTYQNSDYEDINANHVGIDFQTARSNIARDASAGDISLAGGEVIHAWIDYSAVDEQLEVRIGLDGRKPRDPFLSYSVALSEIFSGPVYVGFAGSNSVFCYCHSFYSILYWTFETFWEFHPLHFLLGIISFVVLLVLVKFLHCDRSVSSSDYQSNNFPAATATYKPLPDPPPAIAPREFSFRKLDFVTHGFNHIIRETGPVSIFKGTLRMRIGPLWSSWFGWKEFDVAVTAWTTTNSNEAANEFESMIRTLESVQHGNITRFFGWCREGNKCLLVHEFIRRGDLEYALFNSPQSLSWNDRVDVIIHVCEALCYLQKRQILHRQVKASNILLDAVWDAEKGHLVTKAKLNDFRLAKELVCGDNNSSADSKCENLSFGVEPPEAVKDGKFSEESDVYAFGSVILQIVTGKRTADPVPNSSTFLLCNWVVEKGKNNCLEDAIDPKLGYLFRQDEAIALLKLGLECLQPDRNKRPSMLGIKKYLKSLRLVAPQPC